MESSKSNGVYKRKEIRLIKTESIAEYIHAFSGKIKKDLSSESPMERRKVTTDFHWLNMDKATYTKCNEVIEKCRSELAHLSAKSELISDKIYSVQIGLLSDHCHYDTNIQTK